MNVSSCGCRSYRSCTSPYPPPLPDLLGRTRRLIEVTRITGALSVNLVQLPGGEPIENKIAAAIDILAAANNPPGQPPRDPPARLTLVYYPYYWNTNNPRPTSWAYPDIDPACTACAPTALPPNCPDDPRQTCHDLDAVNEYEARVNAVLGALESKQVSPTLIGQQFFDTERWTTTGEARPGWNDAITAKHDLFYTRGKQLLNVPIYQYERGSITYVDFPLTHFHSRVPGNYYTLRELGEAFSVSLYMVPDLDRMRKMLQATVENAIASAPSGATNVVVVPWVGLACGNRDFADKVTEPFKADWDYGVRAVRDFGIWLRHFAPAAPQPFSIAIAPIGLYPAPFDRATPHWTRYFIAYVRAFGS